MRTQNQKRAAFRPGMILPAAALLWAAAGGLGFADITDADIAALGNGAAKAGTQESNSPTLGGFMLRVGFSLGAVVGLIALVAWGAKRYLPAQVAQGRGGPIEVLASRAIAAKKTLMLVRVREKTVLIGVTPQGMQFLTDVDHGRGGWEEAALHAGIAAEDEKT